MHSIAKKRIYYCLLAYLLLFCIYYAIFMDEASHHAEAPLPLGVQRGSLSLVGGTEELECRALLVCTIVV